MKILETRALNDVETYCCSVKTLKEAFKDRDLKVYFGGIQGSRNMLRNSLYFLPNEEGKIIILLVFTVEKRRKGILSYDSSSSMYIQSVYKNAVFSDLQDRFKKEVVPKLVDFFDKYIDYIKAF